MFPSAAVVNKPTSFLFTAEDAGAQVEIHNFLLKAKSLFLFWFF